MRNQAGDKGETEKARAESGTGKAKLFWQNRAEKERKKQELEEFKVRANENIERFKQSTIDMFKGLTQKKKETSKTDNPEAESPSNVENTGGFKEYYKKHKIGVWIGVVAIIFLVSTCG